jgi:hypothetical protein
LAETPVPRTGGTADRRPASQPSSTPSATTSAPPAPSRPPRLSRAARTASRIDRPTPIGSLLCSGKSTLGYLLGAVIMIGGGLVEAVLGIDAENKSLEDVATPLSVVPEPVAA